MPRVETPIVPILITFSVFTTLILVAYFMLVRYEKKQERKKVRAGYELVSDKNSYKEKFNFLENQEISASTF
jgi:predicted membrane protein